MTGYGVGTEKLIDSSFGSFRSPPHPYPRVPQAHFVRFFFRLRRKIKRLWTVYYRPICFDNYSIVSVRSIGSVLPRNWIPMPTDDKGNDVTVHLVKLSSSSPEYRDVEKKFNETVYIEKIKSIERIQNPYLYQAYQLRKIKMDRENPQENNEKGLFHGTNSANITKINTQGFDRSFTGSAHSERFMLLTLWRPSSHIRPLNGRALCTTCDVINLNITWYYW